MSNGIIIDFTYTHSSLFTIRKVCFAIEVNKYTQFFGLRHITGPASNILNTAGLDGDSTMCFIITTQVALKVLRSSEIITSVIAYLEEP